MRKKKKKESWEIVLKDRFLTNEKPDNPYVMALLYFTVFLLSFLLIFVCFFQLCEVRGTSMVNTLQNGDHVLLLKSSTTYKRGDIVVITKTKETGESTNIIKRVIGISGDTLRFDPENKNDNNSIVRLSIKYGGQSDFTLLEENYINGDMILGAFPKNFSFGEEIAIDDGFIYAMGDNRNVSEDSRKDGQYSVNNVYSKSVLHIEKGSILEKLLKLLYHENNAASD